MTNICVPSLENPFPEPETGPNIGAIAGGVIGAIAIAVVLVATVWYCVKKRRAENNLDGDLGGDGHEERAVTTSDGWTPDYISEEKQDAFAAQRRGRLSAVGSIASTVLTRASNVIQIAYIPGVTNRSPPDSPSMIPPVPPIPAHQVAAAQGMGQSQGQGGLGAAQYDQRYFMPGDIRDSVWSSSTADIDARRSIAPSLARSSVATTIYRNNAIVSPIPAQQALRAKAAMVSVKSGASTPVLLSSNPSPTTASYPGTPAVPAITVSQMHKANAVAAKMDRSDPMPMPLSSIVARSAVARPINLKPKQKKPTEEVTTPIDDDPSSPQDTHGGSGNGKTRMSVVTVIDDSPAMKQAPFSFAGSGSGSGTSSAIREEIANPRRSIDDTGTPTHRHRSSHSQSSTNRLREGRPRKSSDIADPARHPSPFSDRHEI